MGHIPAACALDKVQLVGLVDPDIQRAEALAARFRIPRIAEALDDLKADVDAVILSTPPHIRPALAHEAFSAGLHVLCEKPLANSSAECAAMLAAAERSNRRLAVAHTARFFPNRVYVRSLLEQGKLGKSVVIDVEQGDPYDWPTRTGYTVRPELVSGGVLLNEGLHTLDTLVWWLGRPAEFEYQDDSLGGIESNARIRMSFAAGATCSFRLSRTCKLKNRIILQGDDSSVLLPLYDQSQVTVTRRKRQTIERTASATWNFTDLVGEQLRDFVSCIDAKQPARATGEDGLAVIEFIERCYAVKRQRRLPKEAPLPGMTW
jgi:predicted dehydrogenase